MPARDETSTRKASIRRLVLARRARLDEVEREAAGSAVALAVAALPEVSAARAVLGFASFGTELPTDATMEAVLASGKRLLLPYVDGRRLCAAAVGSIDELAPGYRGIREPVVRTPLDPAAADVVLVPGVAFDRRGRRLGYGGGFYDGFLAEIPRKIPRIGLSFDLQVVEDVPIEDSDEAVDVVVTERRVIRCDDG